MIADHFEQSFLGIVCALSVASLCFPYSSVLRFFEINFARRMTCGLPKLWYVEPGRQGCLLAMPDRIA